ncbi:MAG: alpha/beta hydrolase [Clostridia bacterium]|nr:alpha/beta hydrolase [Clostridia bacterium]
MEIKKVILPDCEEGVRLDVYTRSGKVRDALLIIPGGAYETVCEDHEGWPVAMAFMQKGFNCFVLTYSVKEKGRFPKPLIEASKAMKYIYDNAEELGVNKDRIFALGFSAGGHLCASLGTLWHLEEVQKASGALNGENKPKGILPIYPVISSDPQIAHRYSFYNLLGEGKSEEEYKKCSLEFCVDEKTSPAFLAHSANDKGVNVNNSIRFAAKLSEHKIPFELHIFEDAIHGMSLSMPITAENVESWDNPHNAHWVELADEWMKMQK